jgi:hypothetical protein
MSRNVVLSTTFAATVMLSIVPANAASSGLSLELNRQGKGANIAWTTGEDQQLHMTSLPGGRAWGFTRGVYGTAADALGPITYILETQCPGAEVFVRFHDAAGVMYGRYYPCDSSVAAGGKHTVDPSAQREAAKAKSAGGLVVSAVDFVVRDGASADFDNMTVPYAGGKAIFHDSASGAATVKSRR